MADPSYYDVMLARLLGTGAFGTTDQAAARTRASEMEDAMLRYRLGSKRERRRGEPGGAYAMANYPGLGFAIEGASSGLTPYGSGGIGLWLQEAQDPQAAQRGAQERMKWAEMQRKILGI